MILILDGTVLIEVANKTYFSFRVKWPFDGKKMMARDKTWMHQNIKLGPAHESSKCCKEYQKSRLIHFPQFDIEILHSSRKWQKS